MEGFGVTQDNAPPKSLANIGEFRVCNEAVWLKKEKGVYVRRGKDLPGKLPKKKVFCVMRAL